MNQPAWRPYWDRFAAAWERFFYSPVDARWGGRFRIAFACLAFVNFALLGLDLELLYSESGLMPLSVSQMLVDRDALTLFSLLPRSDGALWCAYVVMMLQIVLLGLGVFPRFQAVCVFVWHFSIQNRNFILFDGEDVLFRLLAFLVIFLPLHRLTIMEKLRGAPAEPATSPAWPFRLIQLEMCIVFLSTALVKLQGPAWRDGTVMYYVVHLDDLYGGVFNPSFLFGYMLPLKLLTWGTLVLEFVAPIIIWWRRARLPTLIVLLVFHAGIHLSMNLNLFHFVMALGWLSFLAQPEPEPDPQPAQDDVLPVAPAQEATCSPPPA